MNSPKLIKGAMKGIWDHVSVCDSVCNYVEMRRIKCWLALLNYTSSPWLIEKELVCTLSRKTKCVCMCIYIYISDNEDTISSEEKRRGGCRKLRVMKAKYYSWLLGKTLFLCNRNYVNVTSGNVIIPPEHSLCHSEIHVWEPSDEL